MKVLEHGKPDRVMPCKITCTNCNALLLVGVGDCYTRSGSSKHSRWTTAYFTCPECHNEQCPEVIQGVRDLLKTAREFFNVVAT